MISLFAGNENSVFKSRKLSIDLFLGNQSTVKGETL